MDMAIGAMWLVIAFVITAIVTKVARGRIIADPVCNRPQPPVVSGCSMIGLLYTLFTKGFRTMVHDQYTKLGSVFTLNFFGAKVTFLVGPEVSVYFFQGSDSHVSHGNALEFTVPIFGKEVAYAVDFTTRNEQSRFLIEALKPAKLRCHVGPMLQEVEEYFEKWGQQGMVDLKEELDQLLMLIASRCLIGKDVRGKLFGNVLSLLHELFNDGLCLSSVLFPYAPTPGNRRRDKARAKLSELFSNIVRSRKRSNKVEEDVLQNMIDSVYRNGRSTTEAEVTGLIITLIFSGQHTSCTTATWTGTQLLSSTKWLAAVLDEQEQIIRKYGKHIDYNVLREMDVLHHCIKEALRMNPPASILQRIVHQSFTVRTKEGNEYEIPSGHRIVCPVVFNSNNPSVYKDPNVYDPDRFGPGREEDKASGKFSYPIFGGGRHACVGEAYAYMQVKVIWSHLLRNFELELVSPFPDVSWNKIVPEAKGEVMIRYTRRGQPLADKLANY